jgi:hypothetical protein
MKNLLATIFILISLQAFSQSQYYIGSKYILWDGHLIQIDSARNGTWKVLASRNWVQDYVNGHGGNGYTNGYGLNLSSNIFSVDTTTIAYKTWAAKNSILMSAGYGLSGGGNLTANRAFVVDSAVLAQYFVRRKDSLTGGYYPYSNPSAFLQSINSLVSAGSNMNITGSGTYGDPYVFSSTAAGTGGGGSNVNLGSGYRWAFPNTNNVRTYFTGLWLTTDSTTNSNALTTKADSASMATYFVRRKDSAIGGYYPYASNPLNYTTAAAIAGIYVPLTRLVNTGNGLTGGGALSGNLTLKADTSILCTIGWRQKGIDSIGVVLGNYLLTSNFNSSFDTRLAIKTTTNVAEGANLYFTNARAQAAITLTTNNTSGAATYSGGVLNIPKYLSGSLVVPLTDATTITTDASLGFTVGATYRVTLGGSRTIANPTNLTDGQRITYELHQDGTGGRTVSWGAMFTWSTDLPVPTLSTNINYVDQVAFVYNASAGKLYVSGYNLGIH